jgi:hypothetical protein
MNIHWITSFVPEQPDDYTGQGPSPQLKVVDKIMPESHNLHPEALTWQKEF